MFSDDLKLPSINLSKIPDYQYLQHCISDILRSKGNLRTGDKLAEKQPCNFPRKPTYKNYQG